jgi:hypothetical protein
MPATFGDVWVAFAWGAVSSVGLVVGALAGSFVRLSHHAIALAMSLGAGLLLASASLELVAKAINSSAGTLSGPRLRSERLWRPPQGMPRWVRWLGPGRRTCRRLERAHCWR